MTTGRRARRRTPPASTPGSSRTSHRRRSGVKHPVHDFLFTYYSQRPAALRRWHPGWGVALEDARGVRQDNKAYSGS